MPLAALEAMLCHRPVIATDAGGNAELIDDGHTGFLAAGPTVRALSAALERTWTHRADLPAMGRAAGHRLRARLPRDPGAELATHLLAAAR
jgi:glycosyltransferase involved in cell wall biosynthesis